MFNLNTVGRGLAFSNLISQTFSMGSLYPLGGVDGGELGRR